TVLRAVGELNRWPKPLVNSAPCGKAILCVTLLVQIVGAYFVFKLARAHERPTQLRFTFVAALVGACLEARWHLPFGVRQVQLRDFFFSSRRRHTRSKRDWSSDVCSSD